MARNIFWIWQTVVCAASVGCSGGTFSIVSGDGGADGSPVVANQACRDLAASACAKLESCAPFLVTSQFGDVPTCTARLKLGCSASMAANGTGLTGGGAEDCAAAFASVSCDDLVSNKLPSACVVKGLVAQGAPCGDNGQCSTDAYCNIPAGQSCGVCAPRSAAGGSCRADTNCQSGLVCLVATNETSGKCVAPGGHGATCDATHPCLATLGCGASGTCGPLLGAGVACTVQNCNGLHGLYCNTQTHVCAQVGAAPAGSACGVSIVDGTVTVCTAGGRCKTAAASLMGTCQAAADDGASCDVSNGPPCLGPAMCANSSCALPSPASCR